MVVAQKRQQKDKYWQTPLILFSFKTFFSLSAESICSFPPPLPSRQTLIGSTFWVWLKLWIFCEVKREIPWTQNFSLCRGSSSREGCLSRKTVGMSIAEKGRRQLFSFGHQKGLFSLFPGYLCGLPPPPLSLVRSRRRRVTAIHLVHCCMR